MTTFLCNTTCGSDTKGEGGREEEVAVEGMRRQKSLVVPEGEGRSEVEVVAEGGGGEAHAF